MAKFKKRNHQKDLLSGKDIRTTLSNVEVIDIKNKIPKSAQSFIEEAKIHETKSDKKFFSTQNNRESVVVEALDFVNKITNGDFYNPKKLNTVIGGYREPSKFFTDYMKGMLNNPASIGRNFVWFSVGGSHWYDPRKVLIIMDPYVRKNRDVCGIYSITPKGGCRMDEIVWNDKDFDKHLKDVMRRAHPGREDGFRVSLSGQDKWRDIADWVVDLARGKLYKISEPE